ncbi:sensor histidine kinase [Sphingomonas koreensis]|nr:sensor histidine kinase [Sphingomonas koreensis]
MQPIQEERRRTGFWASAARLPTGAKLFVILGVVLLVPAVISVLATLQTNRTADQEARARLSVAVRESSRALAIELVGDMTALRVTLNALDADAADAPSCARAQGVFAEQVTTGTRFMVADRQGRVVCGDKLPAALKLAPPAGAGPIAAHLVPGHGLVLAMTGTSRGTTATAFFPTEFLSGVARPSGYAPAYGSKLTRADEELVLDSLPSSGPLDRREHLRANLGIGDLMLAMDVRSAPISSPLLLAMLLPIVMWLAAASIAWFVVDRLLIDPLRRLRASVASYVPGEQIDTGPLRTLPAQEIRELGDTFRTISQTVAAHEAGLAEGLVRQTKLTREVHHRVKNNLQVISSLINFHARGARSRDAIDAYASIQRRVDALAVVHRYHFAEMEENRGLSLRSVIGELASNIRATAPEESSDLSITLDLEPYLASQDVAVAVAFLITEIVELSIMCEPNAKIRVSLRAGETEDRAILRISTPALVHCEIFQRELDQRYGRVMEGLSRQLRSALHHEPLTGAYEIAVAVIGRD